MSERVRVLLVECSETEGMLVRHALVALAVEIVEARDSEEAERRLQEGPFALAIIAEPVRGATALELAARVRLRFRSLPIVFLGESEPEEWLEDRGGGSVTYLMKPVEPLSLAHVVSRLLGLEPRVSKKIALDSVPKSDLTPSAAVGSAEYEAEASSVDDLLGEFEHADHALVARSAKLERLTPPAPAPAPRAPTAARAGAPPSPAPAPSAPAPSAPAPAPAPPAPAPRTSTPPLPSASFTPDAASGNDGPTEPGDQVDCALFSPRRPMRGDRFLVQVFLHDPAQRQAAQAQAVAVDAGTAPGARHRLRLPIQRGTTVQIELQARGLEIEPPPAVELVWAGEIDSVAFELMVPWNHPGGSVILTVLVGVGGVPLGVLKTTLTVRIGGTSGAARLVPVEGDGAARRFEKAFVSYASEDRDAVLARVQMLKLMGVECFQDILDLEPGERWERALYRHIDDSDVFFLFWSPAANGSEWVLKEARYALDLQRGDPEAPPHILPVVLTRPPPVPPPDLGHLHFNDPIVYFLQPA